MCCCRSEANRSTEKALNVSFTTKFECYLGFRILYAGIANKIVVPLLIDIYAALTIPQIIYSCLPLLVPLLLCVRSNPIFYRATTTAADSRQKIVASEARQRIKRKHDAAATKCVNHSTVVTNHLLVKFIRISLGSYAGFFFHPYCFSKEEVLLPLDTDIWISVTKYHFHYYVHMCMQP